MVAFLHFSFHLFEEKKKDRDEIGIELFPGPFQQFPLGFFFGEGFSVGAIGSHAIIGIRDGNDPCPEGDLVSF